MLDIIKESDGDKFFYWGGDNPKRGGICRSTTKENK
jgi:hypothetical protein